MVYGTDKILQYRIEEFKKENAELKEKITALDGQYEELLTRRKEVRKYKETLKFYAESADVFDGYPQDDYSEVKVADNLSAEVLGKRAREVLSE